MLHQFSFKNFKSFKEEVTLDMLASSIKEHVEDVVIDCFDERVLKVAAIYGANASGKSNIIEAFRKMRLLVLNSFSSSEFKLFHGVEGHWFEEETVPTEFSVLFSKKNNIYQYGFSIKNDIIIEEYLYKRNPKLKKEDFEPIFNRKNSQIRVANDFKDVNETSKLLELVSDETLYISVLSQLKIESISDVIEWFKDTKTIDYGNPNREAFGLRKLRGYGPMRNSIESDLVQIIEDVNEKEKLENFIKSIDVGIEKLGVKEEIDSFDEEKLTRKIVVSYHKNPDTKELKITPITSESSGTIKMLLLYADISRSLKYGHTLFVDELDAKLHPLLLRYIIIMFHDNNLNKKNAQLIFSTQEVFTLDKETFRRDEIWFVDKDDAGSSELYSLDSYVDEDNKKIRNDASYGKDYILGRYNSIPNLRKIEDD